MAGLDRAFSDHESWLRQARHLLTAAEVLTKEFYPPRRERRDENAMNHVTGCLKGSLLLLAVAVENALKAPKVAAGGVTMKNGRIDKKVLGGGATGHDLLALAKEINLQLSEQERALLERLTAVANWAGKYQTPLDEKEYLRAQGDNPRQLHLPTDTELSRAIIEKAALMARGINASRA